MELPDNLPTSVPPQGLVVHLVWHLDVGGGELFLRDLVGELARSGASQHVLTIGPPGRLADEVTACGVPVTAFKKSSKLGLATIWRMARAIRRLRPSVVHTHGEAGVFWGLPAALLGGVPSIALVYQNYRETPAKMLASRVFLRWPRLVIAGSDDVARFVHEDFGVPRHRVRTIHCGIVPERFVPSRVEQASQSASHLLVSVGRLVPRKGHLTLITALAAIRRRHPAVRLRIVGDGAERPALERLAVELGVAGIVEFTGTVYPTSSVLADADVFVFPSLVEPQGLALLEAFAAGIPVVASRTGGIPEMLDHGVHGLLAGPGNAADLAAAIGRMLDDRALAAACVANAQGKLESFRIREIAGRYIRTYSEIGDELVARRAAAGAGSERSPVRQ